MKVTVLKEKETPLLARKRITAEAVYQGATPSAGVMREAIAKISATEPKNIEIRHIFTKFRQQKAKVIAHVYENTEVMKKVIKKGKKQLENEAKMEQSNTEKEKDTPPSPKENSDNKESKDPSDS